MADLWIMLAEHPVLAWRHARSCPEIIDEMGLVIERMEGGQGVVRLAGNSCQMLLEPDDPLHVFDRRPEIMDGIRTQFLPAAAKDPADFFHRVFGHRFAQVTNFGQW